MVDYYEEQEGVSPISIGIAWASRILAFSLEFALLVVFGGIIDAQFGVKPWGLLVGAAIGACSFVAGIAQTAKRFERIEARASKSGSNPEIGENSK